MRKVLTLVFALICAFGLTSCADSENEGKTVVFHDQTFSCSELSEETLTWLEWYNSLTETEQLSISYIPADLYKLCGYENIKNAAAETK